MVKREGRGEKSFAPTKPSPCEKGRGFFVVVGFACDFNKFLGDFMISVQTIENAIQQLPEPDLAELQRWFSEFYGSIWDKQIERDAIAGKLASLKPNFSGWIELLFGGFLYGVTAIGWFFLMREFKLVTLSVFHALGVIGFTCLLGVFVFKEKLYFREMAGIALGCCSIILLMRFNEE